MRAILILTAVAFAALVAVQASRPTSDKFCHKCEKPEGCLGRLKNETREFLSDKGAFINCLVQKADKELYDIEEHMKNNTKLDRNIVGKLLEGAEKSVLTQKVEDFILYVELDVKNLLKPKGEFNKSLVEQRYTQIEGMKTLVSGYLELLSHYFNDGLNDVYRIITEAQPPVFTGTDNCDDLQNGTPEAPSTNYKAPEKFCHDDETDEECINRKNDQLDKEIQPIKEYLKCLNESTVKVLDDIQEFFETHKPRIRLSVIKLQKARIDAVKIRVLSNQFEEFSQEYSSLLDSLHGRNQAEERSYILDYAIQIYKHRIEEESEEYKTSISKIYRIFTKVPRPTECVARL